MNKIDEDTRDEEVSFPIEIDEIGYRSLKNAIEDSRDTITILTGLLEVGKTWRGIKNLYLICVLQSIIIGFLIFREAYYGYHIFNAGGW